MVVKTTVSPGGGAGARGVLRRGRACATARNARARADPSDDLLAQLFAAAAVLLEQQAHAGDFVPALVQPPRELHDVPLGDPHDLEQVWVVRADGVHRRHARELDLAALHPPLELAVLGVQPVAVDVGLVAVLPPLAGAVEEEEARRGDLAGVRACGGAARDPLVAVLGRQE